MQLFLLCAHMHALMRSAYALTVNGDSDFTYVLSYRDPDATGNYDVGKDEFNRLFHESIHHILLRECFGCDDLHQYIYYKRLTNVHAADIYYLTHDWMSVDAKGYANINGTDFNLYSTLADAITDNTENAWTYFNGDDDNVGMFRDCSVDITSRTTYQWTSKDDPYGKPVKFFVYKDTVNPTSNPTSNPTVIPTTSTAVAISTNTTTQTYHPTLIPTNIPSNAPTESPTEMQSSALSTSVYNIATKGDVNNGLDLLAIILIIIICVVFCVIILFMIYAIKIWIMEHWKEEASQPMADVEQMQHNVQQEYVSDDVATDTNRIKGECNGEDDMIFESKEKQRKGENDDISIPSMENQQKGENDHETGNIAPDEFEVVDDEDQHTTTHGNNTHL